MSFDRLDPAHSPVRPQSSGPSSSPLSGRSISPSPVPSIGARLAQPVVLLVLMWLIRAADWVLPGSFNGFGVRAWDLGGLGGIVLSPLLHSGWPHLVSNTIPFLVLGLLVAAEGIRRYWFVTVVITVCSGLGAWFVNLPGTLTVGASGLVFGYFGYLIMRAFVADSLLRRLLFGVIGIVVVLVYGGSMLVGALPIFPGISWQGHVFGALGGLLAAWLTRTPRMRTLSGSTTPPQRTGGLF